MNAYTLPNGDWLAYYEERLPEKRITIMESLREPEAYLQAAKCLFSVRHPQKKAEILPDTFLWQLIQILYIMRQKTFFDRAPYKKLKNAFQSLKIPEELLRDDHGKCAVYYEFRNMAVRYMDTEGDINYRKKWFGLQSLTNEERVNEMLSDVYLIGEKSTDICLAEEKKAGREDAPFSVLLSLWRMAVKDAYAAGGATQKDRYEEYAAKQKSN